jgi:Rho termination factor, N-terminal domain
VPTKTLQGNDPQHPILSAVRESQTALLDVVRSWTDITEQLTRRLSLPVAGIDVAGALDRTFDLAEQTLAAQRQFALTLAGAVDRQVDTVVETVETVTRERLRGVQDVLREAEAEQPEPGRELPEPPPAAKAEAPKKVEAPKQNDRQETKPDRRGFEERSVEELRDRARELDIEGRASMSKDELIGALREQRQPKQPNGDAQKATARTQDSTIDRRPFAERSLEELRDRARELEIEGRSAMSKDELIAALRQHAK